MGLRGLDVDFVVAIDAVDHVGDELRGDEDTNDHVPENAKVIIQDPIAPQKPPPPVKPS
jgi:hypothetical protein